MRPKNTSDVSSTSKPPPGTNAEAKLIQFAFKSSNVGYWVWDRLSGYVYLSDAALEMLHLKKNEFSSNIQAIKDLIHPEDYDDLKTSFNTHIKNKTFFEIEFRVKRQDGSYLWINIDGRSHNGASDSHKVGGSMVDATANVRLKEELKQEKRNLRLIFDNVPARIWFKDAHNKIIRLNESAAQSMNLPVKDAEGADTYDLFPEAAKGYHEDDLAVINSGKPLEGIIEKYTPVDGPHGWVRTDKFPINNPETHERFVLVISTDITQQKEYETAILENTLRLDQANRDLDHFAYMASHDLKAPLRGMDELARWIGEDLGENLTPDIRQKIDLLRGRVSRMDTLLKDILAFSRTGKNMAEAEDVNISDLVEEVIDWLPPLGTFTVIKETDLPTLIVPKSALEHIFLNLISNAIKHHDRADGTVTVGYKETEEHHLLYVSDDGPGIPEQYQDHVFEIFKKLKPRDDIEGSGIGLSIVKKMVDALGGKIEILSGSGNQGARFNIFLPKE